MEQFEWDDKSQSWRYGHQGHSGIFPKPTVWIEQIWVGMAALWFLGKLADAYATKLGEWMVETTITALRRIKTTQSNKGQQVAIKVPEGVTIMMLPKGEPADDAKEAFIDLDPSADGISGKLLSWNPEADGWLSSSDDTPRLPPVGGV